MRGPSSVWNKPMKIAVEIPDRISHKNIHIASMETDRGALKSRLEKTWRKYLRRYKPLIIPIRCGFCGHVGEAQWHCHNRDSAQYGINVHALDVCSKWSPNQGLLMMLWSCWHAENREKSEDHDLGSRCPRFPGKRKKLPSQRRKTQR